jgi:hypothetical protein
MTSRTILEEEPASIVPIDDQTHAMLDYAESVEAQARFAQARQELADGMRIVPTTDYFDDLNRRISERVDDSGGDIDA